MNKRIQDLILQTTLSTNLIVPSEYHKTPDGSKASEPTAIHTSKPFPTGLACPNVCLCGNLQKALGHISLSASILHPLPLDCLVDPRVVLMAQRPDLARSRTG